jgi:L-cysteate sulfo-lyase
MRDLTAAAGASTGLQVVLVLAGRRGSPRSGNLALDGLLGARVVWAGDVREPELEKAVDAVVAECRDRGARPATIPFGGWNALGARGYVDGGRELLAQAPDTATVVTAVGSGGTMAGLVTALGSERVLGVDCAAVPEPAEIVTGLVAELSGQRPNPQPPRLGTDQTGAG